MGPQDRVFFRPHADGISDLIYNNYDDWKTLAHDACTVLVPHQPATPVKCAPLGLRDGEWRGRTMCYFGPAGGRLGSVGFSFLTSGKIHIPKIINKPTNREA